MSKVSAVGSMKVFCGIDVSAATLAAAVHPEDQRFRAKCFQQQRQRAQSPDRLAAQGQGAGESIAGSDRRLLAGPGYGA